MDDQSMSSVFAFASHVVIVTRRMTGTSCRVCVEHNEHTVNTQKRQETTIAVCVVWYGVAKISLFGAMIMMRRIVWLRVSFVRCMRRVSNASVQKSDDRWCRFRFKLVVSLLRNGCLAFLLFLLFCLAAMCCLLNQVLSIVLLNE